MSLVMHFSVGKKTVAVSRGFLFLIYKDGIIGYNKSGDKPALSVQWSSPQVEQQLVELVRKHPDLLELLPYRYRSLSSVKIAALLGSMGDG